MEGPPPLIICGPSGVGKSVLIHKLQEVFPGRFGFSVSHTTRDPRPGEVDGKDYHFHDLETMQREVAEGRFIEHAEVHGNLYGTTREAVEAVSQEGKVCILDIDVHGATNIHGLGLWPSAKFVFINPPSLQELERRLRGRGTETEERVQKRLGNALGEIELSKQVGFFNHFFVLDGLVGHNVPKEVVDFLKLVQDWYPSLGELSPDIRVLDQFQKADKFRTSKVAKNKLASVLLAAEPAFSEAEVNRLLAAVAVDADSNEVEYQRFVAFLFKGEVA